MKRRRKSKKLPLEIEDLKGLKAKVRLIRKQKSGIYRRSKERKRKMKKVLKVLLPVAGFIIVLVTVSLSAAQGNYRTEKDKEDAFQNCIEQGYSYFVGKVYIAYEEDDFCFYEKLADLNKGGSGFAVRHPEKFTVTRFFKPAKPIKSQVWVQAAWEVRFESGKIAYISAGGLLRAAASMEEIKLRESTNTVRYSFQQIELIEAKSPREILGKIEAKCGDPSRFGNCTWEMIFSQPLWKCEK
jgi:hypothetical protein